MAGMTQPLSAADMKNVAAYYESVKAKPGFAKNKDLVQLGEKIYRGGIAAKQVPACAGCHSPTGAGIPAQYPRVGGQHADYAEAQLNAFRSGARGNSPQMAAIAAKLSDKEIKAVADYMAGLKYRLLAARRGTLPGPPPGLSPDGGNSGGAAERRKAEDTPNDYRSYQECPCPQIGTVSSTPFLPRSRRARPMKAGAVGCAWQPPARWARPWRPWPAERHWPRSPGWPRWRAPAVRCRAPS